jgi:hypothetical protein
MNKEQIEIVLNNIGDFMGSIRRADRDHNDMVASLSDKIVGELKNLFTAGVSRKVVLAQMLIWNTNTEDNSEIRSLKTINRWLKAAGYTVRSTRSDKGTVKTKGETREQALARIKSLMVQHGITTADLA